MFAAKTRKRIRPDGAAARRPALREGYKGVFCLDFLLDTDDGNVYLGEINPRISGASPLTNLITSRYGGVPLFLFHLLEFIDVDWELDLDDGAAALARLRPLEPAGPQAGDRRGRADHRGADAAGCGGWTTTVEMRFVREETDWHNVSGDDEAFYLRVYGVGEYRYPGADLGILVTRDRMQTDSRELLDRGVEVGEGDRRAVPRRAA